MQLDLGTRLLKMLLVLLLGGGAREDAPQARVDLRAFAPPGAPVYAELDFTRARETVAGTKELAGFVLEGADREAAFESAAAGLGLVIGADTARVKEAFTSVRRAGLWLVSFGEDAHQLRFLALVDTGGARDVLSGLLAGAERVPGYHTTEYAGATIHGFTLDRGRGVWCAETQGMIAAALDPAAVQGFLLRAGEVEPGALPANGRSIIQVEVDCPVLVNMLMATLGRHDRDEFLTASTLLDLPSWERVGAAYDGQRLTASLELCEQSPVARALRQPAAPPGLLDALPEGCGLAFVAGLADARAGWDFVRTAVRFASQTSRPREGIDIEKEIRLETGLEAADLAGDLVAGAFIVPRLERLRDVEDRGLFILEVADPARAEGAIEMFVAAKGAGDVTLREAHGATIWQGRSGAALAIRGNAVVVAPGRDAPVDAVLGQLEAGESKLARSLREDHPRATAFATLDLSGLGVLGDVEGPRYAAGLSFEGGRLSLEAEVDVGAIARTALAGLRGARVRDVRARCMAGLRRVHVAAYRHATDAGELPGSLEEMQAYLRGYAATCAASGRPFVYRSELAGRGLRDFPDRGSVVVAHDPLGAHPDGGAVVYLNGRTEWLSPERFRELVAGLDRDAEKAREGAEREPVF